MVSWSVCEPFMLWMSVDIISWFHIRTLPTSDRWNLLHESILFFMFSISAFHLSLPSSPNVMPRYLIGSLGYFHSIFGGKMPLSGSPNRIPSVLL